MLFITFKASNEKKSINFSYNIRLYSIFFNKIAFPSENTV